MLFSVTQELVGVKLTPVNQLHLGQHDAPNPPSTNVIWVGGEFGVRLRVPYGAAPHGKLCAAAWFTLRPRAKSIRPVVVHPNLARFTRLNGLLLSGLMGAPYW